MKFTRAFFFYALFEKRRPVTALGKGNGAWNIVGKLLRPGGAVLSAGAGADISFELELLDRYGVTIHLMDPSPTGKKTVQDLSHRPHGLYFYPLGLSGCDGASSFAPPQNPEEGSYRVYSGEGSAYTFPCVTVSSWMKAHKISSLELLKLDVEGFEYEIIKELSQNRPKIRQILVEFHHSLLPNISRLQTLLAITRLAVMGYTLVNHSGCNHTFVKSGEV